MLDLHYTRVKVIVGERINPNQSSYSISYNIHPVCMSPPNCPHPNTIKPQYCVLFFTYCKLNYLIRKAVWCLKNIYSRLAKLTEKHGMLRWKNNTLIKYLFVSCKNCPRLPGMQNEYVHAGDLWWGQKGQYLNYKYSTYVWRIPLLKSPNSWYHYDDVIMSATASEIPSFTIAYSTGHSGTDQRKHKSSASLAFVRGIHRYSVNSPHKGPVTRQISPFDDVIICWKFWTRVYTSPYIP